MSNKIFGLINKLFGIGKVISMNGTDSVKLELLPGEIKNRIKYMQQRGFVSIPKQGDKILCLFIGGHRDCGLAVAVDDNEKMRDLLQEGDSCLYSDKSNYLIMSKSKGEAILKTKELLLNDEKILKAIEQIRKDLKAIKTAYNEHIHTGNGGIKPIAHQIMSVGEKP